ncbi:MAG: GreA/GreB family elongation factor [Proteobacteria bacterium]|nr:GreA/GreB family elongation factor [Pseudomonadota bacterium]MCP4922349.1 GreA/GreB family elongation factor [Pseudomonadota bacterium]
MKPGVVTELTRVLREELAAVERVAAMARDEVGNSETKAEGKYDTRSTEASYLARGQAWRVVELRRLVAWIEAFEPTPREQVSIGALVHVEPGGWLFVAPVGGHTVTVDGVRVRAISPASPLGQAMAELEDGDGFQVQTPRGEIDHEVLQVL